jgi:glycosyltransferase involved in cell wall biosynthesis
MATIGIVSPPSQHGIAYSTELLVEVLGAAGHDVRRQRNEEAPPDNVDFDVVLFLERIAEQWLHIATHTVLMPNPEWFRDEFIELLDGIDVVFAKTLDAVRAFEARGCTVVHTGFTSRDQFLPEVDRRFDRWLHVAGLNQQKGTHTVVDVWAANPDFPELTIVQTPPEKLRRPPPPNVALFEAYLPAAIVQVLQNTSGVHVCPSEAEGWGHYIVEGLSVGAVVLTTDAPPMNEHVTPDHGVLCPYATSVPQRFGTAYHVAPDDLAAAVRSTLNRDVEDLCGMGRRARQFFLDNHASFVKRLTAAIDELAGTP